jgi:hypothetical protein
VFPTKVRLYLEELLHNHWTGRGDLRVWPPSLPNLAPTVIFLGSLLRIMSMSLLCRFDTRRAQDTDCRDHSNK